MRLIAKIEFQDVPRDDFWELAHYNNPRRAAYNPEAAPISMDARQTVEYVEGMPFADHRGRRQVIGLSRDAQESLGMLFEVAMQSQEALDDQERRIERGKKEYHNLELDFFYYRNKPILDKFWDLLDSIIDKITITMKEEVR